MDLYPALKAFLIFAAGILAAGWISLPLSFLVPVCCTSALLAFLFLLLRYKTLTQSFLFSLILISGLVRMKTEAEYFPADHITRYLGHELPVILHGMILRDPSAGPRHSDLIVKSAVLEKGDTTMTVTGNILVQDYSGFSESLRYGDLVQLYGRLDRPAGKRNPGAFDYGAYLARRGLYGIMIIKEKGQINKLGEKGHVFLNYILYPARRWMLGTLEAGLSRSNSSLLKALILGDRDTLDPDTRDSFTRSGTFHIMSVSGLHVGYILLALMTLTGLLRLPYTLRILLALAGLFFYMLLTESEAPVVRASVMGAFFLTGTLIDRKPEPFNLVGLSGLLLLAARPQDLLDPGFQLSFSAVASILYFYPKITANPFYRKLAVKLNSPVLKTLPPLTAVSLAAQLGTLPLTVLYFNYVPLLAPLTNLFAIPLSGLVVCLGFTTLLAGVLHPWLSLSYGSFNDLMISLLVRSVSFMGNIPHSTVAVPTPGIPEVLVYSLSLVLLFSFKEVKMRKCLIFTLFFLGNMIIWREALFYKERLVWLQFDVGQGDASLLRFPGGKTLLIDAGPKTDTFDAGERIIAPYLMQKGIRRIDAVILTHPHDDHKGGLIHILTHFRIGKLLVSYAHHDSTLLFLQRAAAENNISYRAILAPDSICLIEGSRVDILSPNRNMLGSFWMENLNNQSLVVRVRYGKTALLFMGDAEKEAEDAILDMNAFVFCNALKIGHHGSHTSSSVRWLLAARPAYGVISAGIRNIFRHPSRTVLERLSKYDIIACRTDKQGAVMFVSDGKTLKLEDWKN